MRKMKNDERLPLVPGNEREAQERKEKLYKVSKELLKRIDRTLKLALSANTLIVVLEDVYGVKQFPVLNTGIIFGIVAASNISNATRHKILNAIWELGTHSSVILTASLEFAIHISGLVVKGEWDLEHNLAQKIGFPLILILPSLLALSDMVYLLYQHKILPGFRNSISANNERELINTEKPIKNIGYQFLDKYLSTYKEWSIIEITAGLFSTQLEYAIAAHPASKYGRLIYPIFIAGAASLAYPENNPLFKGITKFQRGALFLAYALMFISLFKNSIANGDYIYYPLITMAIIGMILASTYFNTRLTRGMSNNLQGLEEGRQENVVTDRKSKSFSEVYRTGFFSSNTFCPRQQAGSGNNIQEPVTQYPAPQRTCTII